MSVKPGPVLPRGNAQNKNKLTGWYRFNVPPPGSITTVDGTTTENRLVPVYPTDGLQTDYAYNSTNQVSTQNSPDGGTNRFWYDLLSRLVASRNDKQLADSSYSYTNFDAIGRITEVGQKEQDKNSFDLPPPDYLPDSTITAFNNSGFNTQITHTWYDNPAPLDSGIQAVTQSNLRKRVAAGTYRDDQDSPVTRRPTMIMTSTGM